MLNSISGLCNSVILTWKDHFLQYVFLSIKDFTTSRMNCVKRFLKRKTVNFTSESVNKLVVSQDTFINPGMKNLIYSFKSIKKDVNFIFNFIINLYLRRSMKERNCKLVFFYSF